MIRLARTLLTAFLVGVALSAALLVFMLLSLLARYSKDLAEVLATWQYVTGAVVVGVIAAALAVRLYAGGIEDKPSQASRS